MARITGLTADRMLQVERQSITKGAVNEEGNLILTTYGGDTINAGYVKGDEGDPGEKGDAGAFSFVESPQFPGLFEVEGVTE